MEHTATLRRSVKGLASIQRGGNQRAAVPNDELNFELSKNESGWSIDRIWSPIC